MSLVKEVKAKEVLKGTVCWFDPRKGYGFITCSELGKDLFVHWENIAMEGFKSLKPGDEVSFELGSNHKGEQATTVRVLAQASS